MSSRHGSGVRTIVINRVIVIIRFMINKNAGVYPVWTISIITPAAWAGLTVRFQIYADFQAFTGGTFHSLKASGAVAALLSEVDAAGGFQWYHGAIQVPAGGGTINFFNQSNHDATITDIEIAAIRISLGNYFSRYVSYNHFDQTVSYDSAAPTTGTWAAGDKVVNTAPSVDGNNMVIDHWVCTVAGTPGTWPAQYISTVSPAN